MMTGRWGWIGAAVVVLAWPAAGARAQSVEGLVAGSLTIPLSSTADNFNPGYGATAGVIWNLGGHYAVRADGTWSTLRPKAVPAAVGTSFDVGARVQYLTAAFVFQGDPGRARMYLLAGLGLYRRTVDVSGGTGLTTVCNPWWFVCDTAPVPASRVAGARSSVDVGVTVGFGVTAGRVFGELRYHYAGGPAFETSHGRQVASGKFFPLTVGVRF